jgi:hypothetical protein
VLSFFSSRRNWDSLNLSPAGTLAGERGAGGVPIPPRGHTLWYSNIYVHCGQHHGVRETTGRQTCFPARIFKEGCGVAKWLVRWSPGFESCPCNLRWFFSLSNDNEYIIRVAHNHFEYFNLRALCPPLVKSAHDGWELAVFMSVFHAQ